MRVLDNFYTAFVFVDDANVDHHCTHKYLGALEPNEAGQVIQLIDGYFSNREYNKELKDLPTVKFVKESLFGKDKNIRVLLPENPIHLWEMLPSLRSILDIYAKDQFFPPLLHFTTDIAEYDEAVFIEYSLFRSGGKLVKTWKIF